MTIKIEATQRKNKKAALTMTANTAIYNTQHLHFIFWLNYTDDCIYSIQS